MKTDVNGCSTTTAGQEQYCFYEVRVGRADRRLVQYDYRTPDGRLFSCVAQNLDDARKRKDAWLHKEVAR